MSFDWQNPPWDVLHRLRDGFLSGRTQSDYWRSRSDLAAYDATFAERIGWKWDAVLAEARQRGMLAGRNEPLALVDWGCGSGIASRRIVAAFGPERFARAVLLDRSETARAYARERLQRVYPQLEATHELPREPFLLALSHVVTELSDASFTELVALAQRATAVLWVEPGTPAVSARLVEAREQLRAAFAIIAPCPHQDVCGLITGRREGDWCHNFAEPPSEVFQSAAWQRFGKELGIDLRSLPVSFLALERRAQRPAPSGLARVLGRPRGFKPYVESISCEHPAVLTRRLPRRADKRFCKHLEKDVGFSELHAPPVLGDPVS